MLYDKAVSDLMPTDQVKKGNKIFEFLKQSIPILMGIFLFFNPFPHTTTIKEVCFYLSALIVFLLMIFRKIDFSFRTPLSIPFALFVLWSFVGLFFALDKPNSIHDFYAHLLEYLAFYYILINFVNSRKRFVFVTWTIIISTTIFSIGGLIYFYLLSGYDLTTRFGLELTQVQTNLIGVVCLFAMILALQHLFTEIPLQSKALLIFCLFGITLAAFLTQTRSTLLAVFVSFFIILFAKRKKILVAFCLIFLVAVVVTPVKNRFSIETTLHNERVSVINRVSLEIIKDYPIFGIGFDMQSYDNKNFLKNYYNKIPDAYKYNHIFVNPHNMLLDIAVRTGLTGLSLFLYVIVMFIQMGWKVSRHGKDLFIRGWGLCLMAASIGAFIQGMFEPTLSGPPAIVLYAIFAMMTILWRLNMEPDNQLDIKLAPS